MIFSRMNSTLHYHKRKFQSQYFKTTLSHKGGLLQHFLSDDDSSFAQAKLRDVVPHKTRPSLQDVDKNWIDQLRTPQGEIFYCYLGTTGLCTSYTPGPMSLLYPYLARALIISFPEREFSIVSTSALQSIYGLHFKDSKYLKARGLGVLASEINERIMVHDA